MAVGRPDAQRAAKGLVEYSYQPQVHHRQLLKRVGRYFEGAPRLVQTFGWMSGIIDISGYSDSGWAGDFT